MKNTMNASTNYITQARTNPDVMALEDFLKDDKRRSIKGSPYSNIWDQVRGNMYCIPVDVNKFNNIEFGKENASSAAPPEKPDLADVEQEDLGDFGDADADPGDFENETQTHEDQPRENIKIRQLKSDIDQFFEHIEAARRSGALLNYCEHQYPIIPCDNNRPCYQGDARENSDTIHFDPDSDALEVNYGSDSTVVEDVRINRSCIMLDFDIFQKNSERQITDTHFYTLAYRTSIILSQILDLSTGTVENNSVRVWMVFTQKVKVTPVTHPKYGDCYKDGFHMYIYMKISKAVKKYLINKILDSDTLSEVFHGVDILNPYKTFLDAMSASVPPLLYGNVRRDRTSSYEMTAVFETNMKTNNNMPLIKASNALFPVQSKELIKVPDPKDGRKRIEVLPAPVHKYNLCHELSVNYEAPNGLIKKEEFDPVPELALEIKTFDERHKDNLISNGELKEIDSAVGDLSVRNSEVKYIQKILSILAPWRVREYEGWRNVVTILAQENKEYKPLAIWFSHRYASAWIKGGLSSLDKIWDWALQNKTEAEDNKQMRRINTLFAWAKIDNPVEYNKAQEHNSFNIITQIAFENRGKLNDMHIAEILHTMFRHKFVCDQSKLATSKAKATQWYEFVLPSDNVGLERGYVYKWRPELRPDNLEIYISKKLPIYIKQIVKFVETRIEATAEDQQQQKYFSDIKAELNKTIFSLGKTSAASGILHKCELAFRLRGFIQTLDTDENAMGVGNGVLKLYPETELIQRYHDTPISRFTDVEYENYDPKNPTPPQREILQAIRDLFYEEDAFIFIMLYLSSTLDHRNKNPILFLWLGEGSNGKSFLQELHLNTLGSVIEGGYATKMNISFLTKDRPNSSNADSEKMLLKHARWACFSESEPGDYLRTGNIKEITGGESLSAREMFEKQSNFRAACHYTVASNNDPHIIGADHGTWRRILCYRYKKRFCINPDPENPFEQKENRKFSDTVNRDPQYKRAYMGILVYYYNMYRDEYNYNLNNVHKPTIDRETNEYRNKEDTINRFLSERAIHIGPIDLDTGRSTEMIPLHIVADRYEEWYRTHIADIRMMNSDIVSSFKISCIKKHIIKKHSGEFLSEYKILKINENYDPEEAKAKRAAAAKAEEELAAEAFSSFGSGAVSGTGTTAQKDVELDNFGKPDTKNIDSENLDTKNINDLDLDDLDLDDLDDIDDLDFDEAGTD